jgi:hypothetical protein
VTSRCVRWRGGKAEEWPPAPHDPRERTLVVKTGPWQVRTFRTTDPKFEYLAERGLWHLQLWHAEAGVSILSPSGLTLGHYEIFPIAGWKHWAKDYAELVQAVRMHHQVEPPSPGTLAAFEAWLVDDPVCELHDASVPLVVGPELAAPGSRTSMD